MMLAAAKLLVFLPKYRDIASMQYASVVIFGEEWYFSHWVEVLWRDPSEVQTLLTKSLSTKGVRNGLDWGEIQ